MIRLVKTINMMIDQYNIFLDAFASYNAVTNAN